MGLARHDEDRSLRRAASLLGVTSGATLDDVIQARRVQAKRWHPDINPKSGSAQRMGRINRATDLLCDFIRRGGHVNGIAPAARHRGPPPTPPAPRVFEVRFAEEVGVPISAPDRLARLELDLADAIQGGTHRVHFVRREPGRCQACAGLGASPAGPKCICPACGATGILDCVTCDGRGWLHLMPGSCQHCDGTGAALVEHSVLLKLPPAIHHERRVLVPGWGDVGDDGCAGNLWVDLVPTQTLVTSAPWRFDHFGHNWPRPEGRLSDGWLAISNSPLPDDEMRELGFWRDPESNEWIRQSPSDGAQPILDLLRQRQFFVPRAGA